MNRSIEQALLSLMPTHGSTLPQPLTELASSLLAQSKLKASTLRAEEEIGRLYACANIACERLKTSLNLPPIEPRPPIPPKVYQKLYSHLDRVLPNSLKRSSSGRLRIPSSKLRDLESEPAEPRALPSRATPTKDRSLAQFRSPAAGSSARGTPKSAARGEKGPVSTRDGLYPWVQPVIRHFVSYSDCQPFAPTMMAGMEAILLPGGRRSKDPWLGEKSTALLGALLYLIITQVTKLQTGKLADAETYKQARKEMLMLLKHARQSIAAPKNVDEEDFWDGWADIGPRDIDDAIERVGRNGWLESDWFRALGDIVGRIEKSKKRQKADGTAGASKQEAKQQIRRADTMLQERYNYLSEERLQDYADWKNAMLQRIGELEKAAPEPMEIEAS